MISTRKLIRMARKWQKKANIGRKRISFHRNNENTTTSDCSSSSSPLAGKGHFVVYSADQKRYSFPISYLNNYIFRELFRLAEEEFGLPNQKNIEMFQLKDWWRNVMTQDTNTPGHIYNAKKIQKIRFRNSKWTNHHTLSDFQVVNKIWIQNRMNTEQGQEQKSSQFHVQQ
ncbi:hypothetical protein M9H77_18001 [Catharanthus roseus]|uniref:Uncharacterized protein n=1 Tax=Catharanthus roseus TaxID=4058 RepID=A0ACC0B683_CATRO|nr:hypothetical protein M9H77_18001 [Catharanthus roseus]